MATGRSTLKQVAAALDVSVATVSRALSNDPAIAERTRERVRDKAREMGYVPNSAGRMLVSGRSGFVGIVVPVRGPRLVDDFLGEFVTGIGEGLNGHGVDLFLATVLENQSELAVLKHVVESGRADGLILNRIAEHDERVAYLQSRNFPFVTHGRVLHSNAPLNWLDTDGGAAFGEAFEMLYALGHRRFGLLTITDPMSFRHYREAGLTAAIAARSDPDVTLRRLTAPRFDLAARRSAALAMLDGPDRPTAVIALFDDLALTLMEEAARKGLSVPDDLSVVGFDNLTASAYVTPGLTTFGQNIRESAKRLTDMLMQVIREKPETPMTELMQPKLLLRGSHGPAPGPP
jgi:LacI family transcriptional regulator